MKRALLCVVMLVVGCATVPQNRRGKLADPIMQFENDALDAHRKAKFYSTREAAAGGDGVPAGGGCGCQ
jgi:starvation-inducible outer membrane lipoprotein